MVQSSVMIEEKRLNEVLPMGPAITGEDLESWRYKTENGERKIMVAPRTKGWKRQNTLAALSEATGVKKENFQVRCTLKASMCIQGNVVIF